MRLNVLERCNAQIAIGTEGWRSRKPGKPTILDKSQKLDPIPKGPPASIDPGRSPETLLVTWKPCSIFNGSPYGRACLGAFYLQADAPGVEMNKGKLMNKVTIFLGPLLAFCLMSLPASAQDPKTGDTKTVTGCLSQGAKAGHFRIAADDGNTYGLRSSSVKLADHVGHTVTITGTVAQRKPSQNSGDMNSNGEQQGQDKMQLVLLDVSQLAMVSDSCKK